MLRCETCKERILDLLIWILLKTRYDFLVEYDLCE
jgi:hypothetical protein